MKKLTLAAALAVLPTLALAQEGSQIIAPMANPVYQKALQLATGMPAVEALVKSNDLPPDIVYACMKAFSFNETGGKVDAVAKGDRDTCNGGFAFLLNQLNKRGPKRAAQR